MSNEPTNFEELKKLLALKRLEQPPPGYFNRFSRGVRARVVAGEDVTPPENWWQRWFGVNELKPGLVGIYALMVGSVLLIGLKVSREVDQESMPINSAEDSLLATHKPAVLSAPVSRPSDALAQPIAMFASSNAVPPPPEIFTGVTLQTIPASYRTGPRR